MHLSDPPPPIASGWPVWAALAGVVFLVAVMLGVDLVVLQRTGHRTAAMIGDAQRSVELVDDLREQAHRLAASRGSPNDLLAVTRRIRDDAAAYDALANFRD